MTKSFNTLNGSIHLEDGKVIDATSTLSSLSKEGFSFVRVLPLRDGWSLHSTPDLAFAGEKTYFSFRVHGSKASVVSFGFASQRGKDGREQQQAYRKFLNDQLGPPDEQRLGGQIVFYQYPWGRISSEYDPRNGTASMTCAWQ